jgi:hypothetical protein
MKGGVMRKIRFIIPLLLIMSLVACATLQNMGIVVKPYAEMTPKEKMAFLYKSYNKQYDDYKVQVLKPNLTENEKVVLRARKEAMVKVYPLIQAADLAIVEGKPFDSANEKLIIDYLRKLGAKIQ